MLFDSTFVLDLNERKPFVSGDAVVDSLLKGKMDIDDSLSLDIGTCKLVGYSVEPLHSATWTFHPADHESHKMIVLRAFLAGCIFYYMFLQILIVRGFSSAAQEAFTKDSAEHGGNAMNL